MKVGAIELSGNVILGPMAGVTSLAYREFMKPFGVALSYSEMISDCGLIYGNDRTIDYAVTSPLDRPVGLQLFGFSAENALKAIAVLEKSSVYDILDINLGCPVYKVVKTGAGSAWLKHPEELYDYMSAVVKASHKPVSAKIRLGWDERSINVFEISKLLESAGVSLLTVHARTSRQMYAGKANYEALRGLKKTLTIPLAISGDIFTLEDALSALRITEADAVMVARGALGNPHLVTEIDHYLKTRETLPRPTILDQVNWAEDFSKRLLLEKGERRAVMDLRGLLPHFFSGFSGFKKIRMEISQNIFSYDDIVKILDGIKRRASL
jgi:tRNA-dihydrouridine synthase B